MWEGGVNLKNEIAPKLKIIKIEIKKIKCDGKFLRARGKEY